METINSTTQQNRALPGLPAFAIVLCSIALLTVILRLYTRLWATSTASWDDSLIVPAIICGLGYLSGLLIQIYAAGWGRHFKFLNEAQIKIVGQSNIILGDLGAASVFFSRASICAFLLRIVRRIRPWEIFLYTAMFLNACVFIGTVVIFSITCVPVSKTWKPDTRGRCLDGAVIDRTAQGFGALNCVVDFMCAGAPVGLVRRMQLDLRVKMGLIVIFGLVLLTAACSIGRLVAVDFSAMDYTWKLVPLVYWTVSEMYGAIIFASVPAMHQLGKHYREHRTFSRVKPSSEYSRRNLSATAQQVPRIESTKGSHDGPEIPKSTSMYTELKKRSSLQGSDSSAPFVNMFGHKARDVENQCST